MKNAWGGKCPVCDNDLGTLWLDIDDVQYVVPAHDEISEETLRQTKCIGTICDNCHWRGTKSPTNPHQAASTKDWSETYDYSGPTCDVDLITQAAEPVRINYALVFPKAGFERRLVNSKVMGRVNVESNGIKLPALTIEQTFEVDLPPEQDGVIIVVPSQVQTAFPFRKDLCSITVGGRLMRYKIRPKVREEAAQSNAEFEVTGITSGRFSSKEVNCQALPRPDHAGRQSTAKEIAELREEITKLREELVKLQKGAPNMAKPNFLDSYLGLFYGLPLHSSEKVPPGSVALDFKDRTGEARDWQPANVFELSADKFRETLVDRIKKAPYEALEKIWLNPDDFEAHREELKHLFDEFTMRKNGGQHARP